MKKLIFTLILSLLTFSCTTLQVGESTIYTNKTLDKTRITRLTESNIFYCEPLKNGISPYYQLSILAKKESFMSGDTLFFELTSLKSKNGISLIINSTSDHYIEDVIFYTSNDKIEIVIGRYDALDELYWKYNDLSKERKFAMITKEHYLKLKQLFLSGDSVNILLDTIEDVYKYSLTEKDQNAIKEFFEIIEKDKR